MEKRVFLAIILSFVVLAVFQSLVLPPPAPPAPVASGGATPAGATAQPGAAPAAAPGAPAGMSSAPAAPAPAAIATPAPAPVEPNAAARDVVVDADAFRAVFSTQGAVLKSWRLKHYLHDGQPLELVPDLGATATRPFTVSTEDAAQAATLAGGLYEPSVPELALGAGPGTLSFRFAGADGLRAQKTFYFQPDGKPYQVNVEVAVDVAGAARPLTLHWGPAIGSGFYADGGNLATPRALLYRDGSAERYTPDDLSTAARHEGFLRFAGVDDHYFLAAAVLGDGPLRVDYQPVVSPIPRDTSGATRTHVAFSITPRPGTAPAQTTRVAFFMGPKDFDVLKSVDVQLVYAIDFGMFRTIVTPLLQALKWVNGFVGNFGWSIIVLTVLINLAMFPLRHRSMVSMRKMQALQPEVKAIQDRYAKFKITDPERQRMNQEMMALYKTKGVNPASGCVPMLLTMPILFAFYAMLAVAIELRGAPFVGWIHDLSARDPYYVWPVLMGGTMFWQQKMMPTTADPTQQKIFMLMPLLFTGMFLAAPSGLVIYWLVSNLAAIAQQAVTNRMIGSPQARPARAATKG
jgi:YidC/Oxa1 family membrane protein insertase